LESDALGAKNAGMRAIWLVREGRVRELADAPVTAVESLSQVESVLATF
jgi:FMN phosphatase YigB (HAD superfamily)